MKTIQRNHLPSTSKKIVAVKVMAFLSWIIYLGIAFANNLMIEAFISSVGLVIISYLIFSRKPQRKYGVTTTAYRAQRTNENSQSHNYLSVFFHSNEQTVQLHKSNAMK